MKMDFMVTVDVNPQWAGTSDPNPGVVAEVLRKALCRSIAPKSDAFLTMPIDYDDRRFDVRPVAA
jgi:hypothetical protein